MENYLEELKIDPVRKFKGIDKIQNHSHKGSDANRINPRDLNMAFFEVVDEVPTAEPRNYVDQIKIYVNGATILLYVWDNENKTWRVFNYYIA